MHSKDGKNSATKDNQEYSSGGYPFNRWMTNDMFFIGSDNLNYVPTYFDKAKLNIFPIL